MDLSPIQRPVKAADVPLERLANNPHLTEADKVAELSRQFEAILLRQILGEAQKTMLQSRFNPQSSASGIYQDMLTHELADKISRSGSFGLARSLEQQFAHELKADKTRPAPAATNLP